MGKGHILTPLERIEYIEENGTGGGSTSSIDLKDVAVPLLKDNWVLDEENNTYSQTANINGLTESANPIILLVSVEDEPTDEEVTAYGCITQSLVNEGSITFIANKLPSISITVIVKNVVASDSTTVDDVAALVNKINQLEAELSNKVNDTDVRLSDARTPLAHNHDDVYYNETEIDGKINTINTNISQLNSDLEKTKKMNYPTSEQLWNNTFDGLEYIRNTSQESGLPETQGTYITRGIWKDGEYWTNVVIATHLDTGITYINAYHRYLSSWTGWYTNPEGNREVLLSETATGGNDIQLNTVNSINSYRNLLFVLFTGNVYLDTKTLDKNLFVSGITQRTFWYDTSHLYYIDFYYVNDTTVRIQANFPSSATLGVAIIGYN